MTRADDLLTTDVRETRLFGVPAILPDGLRVVWASLAARLLTTDHGMSSVR
jgi:hypothetical protein